MEQLTVNEALLQGYTHCVIDGAEKATKITNANPEYDYVLCEKNPVPFQISVTLIPELFDEYLNNQDEVYDESGKLNELAGACDYSDITDQINEAFKNKVFYYPTKIKLVF